MMELSPPGSQGTHLLEPFAFNCCYLCLRASVLPSFFPFFFYIHVTVKCTDLSRFGGQIGGAHASRVGDR